MASDARIETLKFGCYDSDAPDNFEQWASHTRNHEVQRGEPGTFRAKANFWSLDSTTLTEQWLDPFELVRTSEIIANRPVDHVTFVPVFAGTLRYRSGDEEDVCELGDILLMDNNRAFSISADAQHSCTLSIARGIIEDEAGPLKLHGRIPRTAETQMLFDFIQTLTRRLPDMRASSVVPTTSVIRRLIMLAVKRGEPVEDMARNSEARSRAVAYIVMQAPGTLELDTMARDLGLSRAALYRLFKIDGGVAAYDRQRRLRLLHRTLCEEPRSVPLGVLAERFGFHDLSSLARQFRNQFGHPMSQIRSHIPPAAPGSSFMVKYREAVKKLS